MNAKTEPTRLVPQFTVLTGDRSDDLTAAGHRYLSLAVGPEADMVAVANGDFSGLSQPLIVAAYDEEQFREFVWREALFCSDVKRFRKSSTTQGHADHKVLLLLPGWDMDPITRDAVNDWIFVKDRYTCQLRNPYPIHRRKSTAWLLILVGMLAVWGFFAWLILR